ncbi:hypothetical protein AB0K86_02590, partial [Streptomyces clavifer]|uniref:hypothetical protein n=1 Tax=Streptomyces clavifer TaxID=68188 RepID=UPI003420DDD7
METMLLDRETVDREPLPPPPLTDVPHWVPLLLAGDHDDDGSEPHICRGIGAGDPGQLDLPQRPADARVRPGQPGSVR